jgi:hypothetical protein
MLNKYWSKYLLNPVRAAFKRDAYVPLPSPGTVGGYVPAKLVRAADRLVRLDAHRHGKPDAPALVYVVILLLGHRQRASVRLIATSPEGLFR